MSKSLRSMLAVSTVVALGIGVAWSTAVMWLAMLVGSAMQGNQNYEQLYVTPAGEPVIIRLALSANLYSVTSAGTYGDQEVVDLAGKSLNIDTQQLVPASYSHLRIGNSPAIVWGSRIAAVNDNRSPATYWYLVHDGRPSGRACGIGYHSRTRRVVGYFGTRGFSEHPLPADQCFEIPGNTGLSGRSTNVVQTEPYWNSGQLPAIYIVASGKLWEIDTAHRVVRSLVDCSSDSVVGMAYVLPGDNPPPELTQGRFVLANSLPLRPLLISDNRLTIVNPESGETRVASLPEVRRTTMLGAFVLPDDKLLALTFEHADWREAGQPVVQQALWFDRSGKMTRREEVRTAARSATGPVATAWVGVVAAPLPLAGLILTPLVPVGMQANGLVDSYGEGLALLVSLFWPCLLALLVIGAVCAALAYRRQRKFGLPGAVAWATFAFIFGIPGWIAYRIHRPWPVLEECPSCQQSAPRDREHCTECGSQFPPPPLKGIEVFA